MKPLDELMADWRRTIAWMEDRVRESGKRVQPLTPEQQLEHEQMVRVLMEEREKLRAEKQALSDEIADWIGLVVAPRPTLRDRLQRAGISTAFDMIWRSR